MKQVGGIGLMKELKDAGMECEFVILTYSWSTASMRDFFHSGGFDYHLKPLNSQNIIDVLNRLKLK